MRPKFRPLMLAGLFLAGFIAIAFLAPTKAVARVNVDYYLVSAEGIWDNNRKGRVLKLLVEFTNTSNEKARITRIYDKNIHFSGVAYHNNFANGRANFNKQVHYSQSNNVDIYPGKSKQLYFLIPYEDFLGSAYISRKNRQWPQAPRFNIDKFNMRFRYSWVQY